MKILPIITQNNVTFTPSTNIQRGKIYKNDTFIKSTPSFTGNAQKAAKEILNNSSLFKMLTAAIAAAITDTFYKLVYDSMGSENKDFQVEPAEQENIAQECVEYVARKHKKNKNPDAKATTQEDTKIITESGQNKNAETSINRGKKTENLQEMIYIDVPENTEENPEQITIDENTNQDTTTDIKEDVPYIIFPGKHGRLSKSEQMLKEIVSSMHITPEYNAKLVDICKEILKKGSKDAENVTRTENLINELNNAMGNTELIKAVIDMYLLNEKKENIFINTEGSQDSVKEKKLGVTIVGQMDLSTIQDKNKRPRITRTDSQKTEKIDNKNSTKAVNTEESEVSAIINNSDYNIPAGRVENAQDALNKTLLYFQNKYIEQKEAEALLSGKPKEYIKWAYRKYPIQYVNSYDIINEVSKVNKGPESMKYINVNRENAEQVAMAINEEPRLQNLFRFHGAVRLIDRFVDFESEYDSIEDQVHHIVDVLEKTIIAAVKDGVKLEEYDDVHTCANGTIAISKAFNMIIPTTSYDTEARKIFGSYPLKLGLYQKNPDTKNNRYAKEAVIGTIFPTGV